MSDLSDQVLASYSAENQRKAPDRREIYTFTCDAVDTLAGKMKELRERIDRLEGRADTLEKSGARFRGVYQRASSYRLGDQATHKGSLWTALGDVPEGTVPGEDPTRWQLAAKGTG